jgi:hypothetical protein
MLGYGCAEKQIRLWLEEQRYCAQWNLPEGIYTRQLLAWPEEFDGASWMRRFDGKEAWVER